MKIDFDELNRLAAWARSQGVTRLSVGAVAMTFGPQPSTEPLPDAVAVARDPRTLAEIEEDLLFASSPGYYSHSQRHEDEARET